MATDREAALKAKMKFQIAAIVRMTTMNAGPIVNGVMTKKMKLKIAPIVRMTTMNAGPYVSGVMTKKMNIIQTVKNAHPMTTNAGRNASITTKSASLRLAKLQSKKDQTTYALRTLVATGPNGKTKERPANLSADATYKTMTIGIACSVAKHAGVTTPFEETSIEST